MATQTSHSTTVRVACCVSGNVSGLADETTTKSEEGDDSTVSSSTAGDPLFARHARVRRRTNSHAHGVWKPVPKPSKNHAMLVPRRTETPERKCRRIGKHQRPEMPESETPERKCQKRKHPHRNPKPKAPEKTPEEREDGCEEARRNDRGSEGDPSRIRTGRRNKACRGDESERGAKTCGE